MSLQSLGEHQHHMRTWETPDQDKNKNLH